MKEFSKEEMIDLLESTVNDYLPKGRKDMSAVAKMVFIAVNGAIERAVADTQLEITERQKHFAGTVFMREWEGLCIRKIMKKIRENEEACKEEKEKY